MVDCPNCGTDNPTNRAFCQVCGERLPQEPTPPAAASPPPQDDESMLDWLLAEDEPASATSPEPASAESNEAEVPEGPAQAGAPEARKAEPAEPSVLPDWLQGLDLEEAPPPPSEPGWDEELDFSDLPEWQPPEEINAPPQPPRNEPASAARTRSPFDDLNEGEASGLLAGIRGPIPIEPVVSLSHTAPAFPTREESTRDEEAVNLLARIAGGAVVPEPVALPTRTPRGTAFFHLLLLVVIAIPLVLGPGWLGAPPPASAAQAYWQALEELPVGSHVLIAFEYEGGMSEELTPAALATLQQIRGLTDETGEPRVTLYAVSTTPQGIGLANELWAASSADAPLEQWMNLGFLPGGSIGLRTLFDERIAPTGAAPISMVVVIGNETADVQRWIEQVGSFRPDMPMLAIAPALAEATLTPYLASGQLDGLIAGIPGAASYEFYGLRTDQGLGWRRIDATTLGALLLLGVILVGNLAALARRAQREER